jgi:hypothetical protein
MTSPLADINAAFLIGWIFGTVFTILTAVVCYGLLKAQGND